MTTGRINQVATLRSLGATPNPKIQKRTEAPSVLQPSEESRDRWVYFPECGNKPPPTGPPIKNRQTGPWGLSLAAISALNSRDGPRNRRILPASLLPRRTHESNRLPKGNQSQNECNAQRPTSTKCLPQAIPWRGRHHRPQHASKRM